MVVKRRLGTISRVGSLGPRGYQPYKRVADARTGLCCRIVWPPDDLTPACLWSSDGRGTTGRFAVCQRSEGPPGSVPSEGIGIVERRREKIDVNDPPEATGPGRCRGR